MGKNKDGINQIFIALILVLSLFTFFHVIGIRVYVNNIYERLYKIESDIQKISAKE